MEKRKSTPEYQIKDMSVKNEAGEVQISWRFKEGTNFLICVYNSNTESDMNLEKALDALRGASIKDSTVFSANGSKPVYIAPNGINKIFCIKEKEFIKNGKKCILSNTEFSKSIPYIIRVYVCQYLKEEDKYIIYESETQENTEFIPANITVEKKEEKPLFPLFGKTKRYIFKFPQLDDYVDGALMYHVDGIEYDFPLTEGCMAKEIVITVSIDKGVHIKTAEEYRNKYKIKVIGG